MTVRDDAEYLRRIADGAIEATWNPTAAEVLRRAADTLDIVAAAAGAHQGGELRVLVCGDRHWRDERIIRTVLAGLGAPAVDVVVIHGAARGADSIADRVARRLGYRVESYPAEWERYGKAAGPIRNRRMLVEGRPDVVIAFHDDLAASTGTADMVTIARRAAVLAYVIGHGQPVGERR